MSLNKTKELQQVQVTLFLLEVVWKPNQIKNLIITHNLQRKNHFL